MAFRPQPQHPMPDDVLQALELSGLKGAYDARPAYQRNDYVVWIDESRREMMRRKRIRILLNDLETGGLFMGSPWNPKETR